MGITKYISFIILILLIVIAYKLIFPPSLTTEDCLKLGSNLRMAMCLSKIKNQTTKPNIPFVELNKLSLDGGNMSGEKNTLPLNKHYSGIYTVNLRNYSEKAAKNIKVRFKLFNADDPSCDGTPQDTIYEEISKSILPGDSQAIRQYISTNFDISGRFKWCTDIVSADE